MEESWQDQGDPGEVQPITLRLPRELVARIDRIARAEHRRRHGQILHWLQRCVEIAEREDAAPQ